VIVGVGVMEGVRVMVEVLVIVGVAVAVRVAVAVGVLVGIEVEVAVGGSGLGVADGVPAAGALHALNAAIPAISSHRMGVRICSRELGMAYGESVGQPKSSSNVPKVA